MLLIFLSRKINAPFSITKCSFESWYPLPSHPPGDQVRQSSILTLSSGRASWLDFIPIRLVPLNLFSCPKILQIVLRLQLRGGDLSVCTKQERTRIRKEMKNCFVDDPKLESYFESILPKVRSQLA